jgi:pSer/pThr/pTyr-binding forkhead associated (FHA) protein
MSTSKTTKPRATRQKQTRGFTLDVIRGPLHSCSSSSGITKEGSSFRIGRTKSSKLQIKDETVSEKHGELKWNARKGWEIRDLGSSNGTSVNGEELAEGVWRVVKTGDEVRIGETTVVRFAFWEEQADDVAAGEGNGDAVTQEQEQEHGRKRERRGNRESSKLPEGSLKAEGPVDGTNDDKENAVRTSGRQENDEKTRLVVAAAREATGDKDLDDSGSKRTKATTEVTAASNKTVLEHIEAHCAKLERELVEQGAEAARRLREAWEGEKRKILDSLKP